MRSADSAHGCPLDKPPWSTSAVRLAGPFAVIPLRAGQRWAWWACWAVMIAYLGYTFIFGMHGHAILARSLIGVIALPILLLAQIPVLDRSRR